MANRIQSLNYTPEEPPPLRSSSSYHCCSLILFALFFSSAPCLPCLIFSAHLDILLLCFWALSLDSSLKHCVGTSLFHFPFCFRSNHSAHSLGPSLSPFVYKRIKIHDEYADRTWCQESIKTCRTSMLLRCCSDQISAFTICFPVSVWFLLGKMVYCSPSIGRSKFKVSPIPLKQSGFLCQVGLNWLGSVKPEPLHTTYC